MIETVAKSIEKLKNDLKKKQVDYTVMYSYDNSFDFILDFSEHDKVFADRIVELLKKNDNLLKMINELQLEKSHIDCELYDAKQRIAELERSETETCEKEPKVSDSAPSIEWYENRHQSDCIEINRLNTTIDVLIHKVEYLRQFAGLE